MSKYDFDVDLSIDTSTGKILNKIKEGSTVLEFGCATGRMTRYMKEELGCNVYIVEYEREAFEKAYEYAVDGVCGDIQQWEWKQKFNDVNFDYILFVDVLEHLTKPNEVLRKAAELLKPEGYIYVSIPNVTHNDILVKAMDEHFDYTNVGLLDNTHVHFWGLENLYMLVDESTLFINSIETTYCKTGMTEQFSDSVMYEINPLLSSALRDRKCGEVYQFVLSISRVKTDSVYIDIPRKIAKSKIYFDTGSNYNETESAVIEAELKEDGSFCIEYDVPENSNISSIRLDPTTMQSCIISNICISQGIKRLDVIYPEHFKMESGIMLPGPNPMIFVNVDNRDVPLHVKAEILLPGREYFNILEKECVKQAGLHRTEIFNLECKLENAKNEIKQKEVEIGAYIVLANHKDEVMIDMEQQIKTLKDIVDDYEKNPFIKLKHFCGRCWRRINRLLKTGKHDG